MTNAATYTADVTPSFDGLTPQYEVSIYVMRPAGVCGPFVEAETVASLEEVDAFLARWQFARTGEFGDVCTNGFASAPLVRL